MSETLIAFCDGSYKKVKPVAWKHSQWIHFTLQDGSMVSVNPANVNYLHIGKDGEQEKKMAEGDKALSDAAIRERDAAIRDLDATMSR